MGKVKSCQETWKAGRGTECHAVVLENVWDLLLQVLEPLPLFPQVAGKETFLLPPFLHYSLSNSCQLCSTLLGGRVYAPLRLQAPSPRVRLGHHPTLGVDQGSPEPQGLAAVCHFPPSILSDQARLKERVAHRVL